MKEQAATTLPERAPGTQRLSVLLAMAMFVLVVDVQSAIALEALVSTALILIGSQVGT